MSKILTLWTDGDPQNQPDGTARLILNADVNTELGSNTNADGFELLTTFPSTYLDVSGSAVQIINQVEIGKIPLNNNAFCIFSVSTDTTVREEIGILYNDGTYSPKFRCGPLVTFGFDVHHCIEGTFKQNTDGTISIYWVDNKNSFRWLNLDNPTPGIDGNLICSDATELEKTLVFQPYSTIEINTITVENGGNLPTGVIYPIVAYADKTQNGTDWQCNFNPIPIVDELNNGSPSQYDGAPAGTISPKQITLRLENIDPSFPYIKVGCITKIGGVLTPYFVSYVDSSNVDAFNSLTVTINSLDNATKLTLDEVLITQPKYIPKTITQLDSVLYLGNLQVDEEVNLQPWVNGIKVNYTQSYINASSYPKDEIYVYSHKGFMYGEVYALYVRAHLTNGKATKAFHIPGRKSANLDLAPVVPGPISISEAASLSNFNTLGVADPDIANGLGATDTSPAGEIHNIDSGACVYHAFDTADNANATTNMGFWANTNEVYPDTDDWTIKDISGAVVGSLNDTVTSRRVRHHKFPDPVNPYSGTNHTMFGTLREYTNPQNLGIVLSNIVIPTIYVGIIDRLEVMYAKRTNENKLILGQSFMFHMNKEQRYDGANYVDFTDGVGQQSDNFRFSTGFDGEITKINTGWNPARRFIFDDVSDHKYFRMSPFDIVSNNSSLSQASFVRNYGTFNIKYTQEKRTGTTSSNAGICSGTLQIGAAVNIHGGGIADLSLIATKYSNRRLRKAALTESIPDYGTSLDTAYSNTALGFSKVYLNYMGEKNVSLELVNGIASAAFANKFQFNIDAFDFLTITHDNGDILFSNLCSYKTDIYKSFDAQELCSTGVIFAPTSPPSEIYGGDSLVQTQYYRNITNMQPVYNFKNENAANTPGNLIYKTMYSYITQGVCNQGFRHQGTGIYDIYYPKSDYQAVMDVPPIPNGYANYIGYNTDYSSVNDLVSPLIHSKIPTYSVTKFPTRIIRSGKDNLESTTDYFRTFLANDYKDLPKNKGAINHLRTVDNKLAIHFENDLMFTLGRERLLTDKAESYIGSGDIFQVDPKSMLPVDNGYGGSRSQWASLVTQYGYFYPDIERGKVFLYGSENPEISNHGMFYFFRDNLAPKFEKNFINLIFSLTTPYNGASTYTKGALVTYNNVLYRALSNILANDVPSPQSLTWKRIVDKKSMVINGIDGLYCGLTSGYDAKYKRILLSKKDLNTTNSFDSLFIGYYEYLAMDAAAYGTICFKDGVLYTKAVGSSSTSVISDPEDATIIYGLPVYFNDGNYFQTVNEWTLSYHPELKGWTSYYSYTPNNYLSHTNVLYNTIDNRIYRNNATDATIFYNTLPEETIIEPIFSGGNTITKLSSVFFNTKTHYRTTPTFPDIDPGYKKYLETFDSIQAYDSYQLTKETDLVNQLTTRNLEGKWSVNEFRDYTTDNSTNLFEITPKPWLKSFDLTNISLTKHWSKLKRLVDYWFGVRFKTKNYKTVITSLFRASWLYTIPPYNQPAYRSDGSTNYPYMTYTSVDGMTIRLHLDNVGDLSSSFTVGNVYSFVYYYVISTTTNAPILLYGSITVSSKHYDAGTDTFYIEGSTTGAAQAIGGPYTLMEVTESQDIIYNRKLHLLDVDAVLNKNIR